MNHSDIVTNWKYSSKSKARELRENVTKLRKAIFRKGTLPKHIREVYPYWLIEAYPPERLNIYPHLIVLTNNITPDGKICIKLLKVELDNGRRRASKLMRKMIGLTGSGLVLCPSTLYFDRLIREYNIIAKTDKIVTDGIYFGVTSTVLSHGILGPTFITLDGTKIQFQPMQAYIQDALSEPEKLICEPSSDTSLSSLKGVPEIQTITLFEKEGEMG